MASLSSIDISNASNRLAGRPANAQTGTTYTLALTDAGKLVTLSNAAAIALTIPTNAAIAFPVGSICVLSQIGAGVVTIAGSGGVTVNSPSGYLVFPNQYGKAVLEKTATDTWLVDFVGTTPAIKQNSQSAAYTTKMEDAGAHILHPTADNNARTITIDSNANVPYPIGTAITFVNQINVMSIAITSDTLTLAGAGTTGTRALAASNMATAIKIGTTSWMISGSSGLT